MESYAMITKITIQGQELNLTVEEVKQLWKETDGAIWWWFCYSEDNTASKIPDEEDCNCDDRDVYPWFYDMKMSPDLYCLKCYRKTS